MSCQTMSKALLTPRYLSSTVLPSQCLLPCYKSEKEWSDTTWFWQIRVHSYSSPCALVGVHQTVSLFMPVLFLGDELQLLFTGEQCIFAFHVTVENCKNIKYSFYFIFTDIKEKN